MASDIKFVDFDKCMKNCKKCETCSNKLKRNYDNCDNYTSSNNPKDMYNCKKGLFGDNDYNGCNKECANCMQCSTWSNPPLSYITSIPEDFLNLTYMNQAEQPYVPVSGHFCNKKCENCNSYYLNDRRKNMCFDCERKLVDKANMTNKSYDPYYSSFLYQHIKEY
jgi:hypothetical protein